MFNSRVDSQAIIAKTHTLLKLRASALNNNDLDSARKYSEELENLGGMDTYQAASVFGESTEENMAFNASLWVLTSIGIQGLKSSDLCILDVGAIRNHYTDAGFKQIVAIDLRPLEDSVIKMNLLDMQEKRKFDVIVLSLVLNFEGDPRKRGEMLRKAANLIQLNGLLFIALPCACIGNSRYLKHTLFLKMLKSIGFELVNHKNTAKLSLYIFKLATLNSSQFNLAYPRRLVRGGTQRNNFCIILEGDSSHRKADLRKQGSKRQSIPAISEGTKKNPAKITKAKKFKSSKQKKNGER